MSVKSAPTTSAPWTSSPADSPARTSPSLGEPQESAVRARVFGGSSLGSFASFDPATSSWRTPQFSLLGEWMSFSGTWPRAGMTRSGTAYQLRPSAPRTSVIASGSSLPGPNSHGLWPTPTTGDHATRFKQGGMPLGMAVRMWPTMIARDARSFKGAARSPKALGTEPLTVVVGLAEGVTTGGLNPRWVEWLMGYPDGWTDLGASETRSSRRSSKKSAGGSSRGKKP